jgi:hypothetical protein
MSQICSRFKSNDKIESRLGNEARLNPFGIVDLGQDFFDHTRSFHTCQSLIKSLEFEAQPSIIDAHAMQDSRIEVI